MSDFILTAKVGDNSDLFPDILRLYVPKGSTVLDMTYGNGVFWKKIDENDYLLFKNDIDPERGDYHEDCRHTSWPDGDFSAVVLDPPYLYVGGFKTLKESIDRGYSNKSRAEAGIVGVEAVDLLYYDAMREAHRLLKPGGILIVKCADQVMSGKQVWGHVTYLGYGDELGFENMDLFVMVQKSTPTMRHKRQIHARRNHSYFLVMRKRRT